MCQTLLRQRTPPVAYLQAFISSNALTGTEETQKAPRTKIPATSKGQKGSGQKRDALKRSRASSGVRVLLCPPRIYEQREYISLGVSFPE